jgi:hypothetical protein
MQCLREKAEAKFTKTGQCEVLPGNEECSKIEQRYSFAKSFQLKTFENKQ